MRSPHKILLIGLATLLALAGAAVAGPSLDVHKTVDAAGQTATGDAHAFVGDDPVAHATSDLSANDATASTETLVNAQTRYADGDAGAATDEAGAMLDTDASLSDPEAAADEGGFAWLEVGWSAFASKVTGFLGLDDSAADGGATVYASDDGVDLDANAAGHDYDGSPAGDADGHTWTVMAQVKAALGRLFG